MKQCILQPTDRHQLQTRRPQLWRYATYPYHPHRPSLTNHRDPQQQRRLRKLRRTPPLPPPPPQTNTPASQIAKDTILALDPLASQHPHPQPIAAALPLLRAFTTSIATATAAILASLSTSLAFPAAAGFHHRHRTLNRPSPDLLRLLKYPAQPAHERGAPQAPHTDLGTLTVLFASGDGLQRQAPRTGAWEYVVARRGCAVVNVGDGLEALSGGLLRSCVHRVVPVPGRAMRERWSFAYMQRAETGTLMAGLKGGLVPEGGEGGAEVLTCEEWLRRKFGALRRGTRRAEEEWVVTGRKVE